MKEQEKPLKKKTILSFIKKWKEYQKIIKRELKEKQKYWKGSPIVLIFTSILILVFVSGNYFSFLEIQFFEERESHIVELTEKASEIVDGVIEHSWQQMLACEYTIRTNTINSEQELLEVLVSSSNFINEKHTLALAIDENANYYSSDTCTGHWSQTEVLSMQAKDMQHIVSEIPHKTEKSYFMFLKRLEEPIIMQGDNIAITHLVLAIDIETMREKISVKGFGEQCYTYLVNQDGRRLYKYTYTNNFIEGYNVLNAFRDYKILHGGQYEDFVQNLEQGKNTVLEFEFIDSNNKKEYWFVANAPISSENWQILLFVPTEVLGANTSLLMSRTICFFIIVSIVFILMVAIIIAITMISKANRQLIKQKDEANRLLKVSAEEARSANQAKSDFLSHMSHDIRTPINGIMGMTDIAFKNIGNQEKILDCLNKINSSSQHLLGLINDVLDMSRIESGKTKVKQESFDIRTCIDNCASIIGGQLVTRDIELVKEVDKFEHPLLIGDELHLRQVFINILGNSVKFTPDGGKIYFRVKEIESLDGKAFFQFELEDTGIGMKEDFLPHLFEAFSQEDDGTRTTYKGTGLGMAITKKFLDMMGATVKVESKLNVGTKFQINLWFDIDKDTKINETKIETHVNLKGMKILLVEDIELNLEIAQSILEEEGVIITPAMNGQEAVDAFINHPMNTFDAILMDIMMPVMDGITATKTIRALDRPDAKTIPIIAMTANAYEEDIRNTHEAGMNEHLSKPIDIDLMLNTISYFYHSYQNEEQTDDLTGLKALLADDVELNLEIAEELLKGMGVIVTTAQNGKEVVDIFSKNPEGTFDVILIDVHMPVMDGITASKTIREMERKDAHKIPIIAMTADVYEEDIKRTKEAGMNGHLAKPLQFEKIIYMLSGVKQNIGTFYNFE